jgi:hypothetical protein
MCRAESVWYVLNSATVDLNLKYLQHEFTKDCTTMTTSVFNCQVNASSMKNKDNAAVLCNLKETKLLHVKQVYISRGEAAIAQSV